MLIYLPHLMPQLAHGPVPDGVRFLDPGLAPDGDPLRFRPANLPLDPAHARRYLRDNLSFGENFPNPRDLAYFSAGSMEDFYSDSRMDIASRLANSDKGKAPLPDLSRNQGMLLLAWTYEERLTELGLLDKDIDDGFDKFSQILGIEEGEGRLVGFDLPASSSDEYELSWRAVAEAALAFVPEDASFYVDMPRMLADLEEEGVVFTPVPPGKDTPASGAYLEATVAGHLLAGHSRAHGDNPRFSVDRRVIRPAPHLNCCP